MNELCGRLERFVDGELEPVDAENFRHHLTRCDRCEARMKELVAMELLADDAVGASAGAAPNVVRGPPAWRRKTWLMVVPLALAAGLASLVLVPRTASLPDTPEAFLSHASTRRLEARVTHPGADGYRPYEVMRSGGTAPQPLPMREMARLEEAGDERGVAMAFLLRGELDQASAHLDKLPASPDLDTDRAVLALQRGAPEEALPLLERALKARPGHPQALWNRGLAMQGLGLWLKAAESFEQVAALKEPGWSQEAAERARRLREQAEQERKDWKGTKQDCDGMVAGGALLSERQVDARPGLSRLCFYDALRAADSAGRVEALRPLAAWLDRKDGGTHLEDAVRRAAGRDFRVRAPLAADYVWLTRGALKPDTLEPFLARLREARQEDILLGALLFVRDARRYEAEYRALALATRDPWFALLAEEQQAQADVLRGQAARAKERLATALRTCGEGGALNYRCLELRRQLAHLESVLHRPVEARAHALAALARARSGKEWAKELRLVQHLGQIARTHGDLSLARAYMEDALLRMPEPCSDPQLTETAHTNLALAFYRIHDFASAREQVDLVARCGQPPSLPRAFVLADLAHTAWRRDDDAALLARGLESLRASGPLESGEAPLLRHIEGRFAIEQDRRKGQELLRQALHEALPLSGSNANARKARAYSYTSLILDAAKHGELERAMHLFAEERALPAPERCTLGVTVDDERTAVVARDASGRLLGGFSTGRREPLTSVEGLVPADVVDALRACPHVDVLARPPVQGHAGLLPPELAWTYRVGAPPASPRMELPSRRLVVADVVSPVELGLPTLRTWRAPASEDGTFTTLRGAAATPSRVLEAMRDATEVQIHAHGIVAPGVTDGSLLVLSPEVQGGRYALTASDLQGKRLQGRPVVLLAACHAAHSKEYFHETFGLPGAFIEAGARTVLAATKEIPDAEVSEFFEPVLARIREGEPAALVLRDARQDWLRRRGDSWVRQVLLFE